MLGKREYDDEHHLCLGQMKRLTSSTVERKLLIYFMRVCVFNFLLVAGVCFLMRQPFSFFRTLKFVGIHIHCLDSAPILLCMFTTFKPVSYKLKVLY